MPSRPFASELSAGFASHHDEILGPLTVNIGTIQGGSKINIVPDLCEARIDIRTIPGQDLAPLLDSLAERFPGIWNSSERYPVR